jgi:hypothetical protein
MPFTPHKKFKSAHKCQQTARLLKRKAHIHDCLICQVDTADLFNSKTTWLHIQASSTSNMVIDNECRELSGADLFNSFKNQSILS